MSSYSETLETIKAMHPYTLVRLADVMDPNEETSPGARWLASVRDTLVEAVEYAEGDLSALEDRVHEIADGAVEVYTGARWEVFTDLGMWHVDIAEVSTDAGAADMTRLAGLVQYVAAETLVQALLGELQEATEEHAHRFRVDIADMWCDDCGTVTDFCQVLNPF